MQFPVIEFKSGNFTLSTLKLCAHSLAQIDDALARHIGQAPSLFDSMPVILDVENASAHISLADVLNIARRHGLKPIAITHPQRHHYAELEEFPLPCLMDKTERFRSRLPPLVIEKPVRSGQQIYAKERDLIVLSNVSAGAEIIADGHIQVTGALRGRVFVGASGDPCAHLISHNFQPELVALAGNYQTIEQEHRYWGQSVLMRLQGSELKYSPLLRS